MELVNLMDKLSEKLVKPKACRDCKYSKNRWIFSLFRDYRFMRCTKYTTKNTDYEALVSGKQENQFNKLQFCSLVREFYPCGIEGKDWEAKK